MDRFTLLTASALAVLLPGAASAQPGMPGSIRVTDAKVEKGKITWTELTMVPVVREVTVEVERNGKKVVEKRLQTAYVCELRTRAGDLKATKVTDAAGKAIAPEKIAKLLKETTTVVLVTGTLPDKHRKLFKDTTLFIELPLAPLAPAGKLPVPGPTPVPVPAPKM